MSRFLIQVFPLLKVEHKEPQSIRSHFVATRIYAAIATFVILASVLSSNLAGQELPDGHNFVPPISADSSEKCGPLQDRDWCYDGHRDPHQKGLICYDVIDLRFSDLVAIEYSMFTDRNCTAVSQHFWNPEGFTVLLRWYPSDSLYKVISAQTCGHHKTSTETWDRLYSHEAGKYWNPGLLMAEGSHAFYVHMDVCQRQFEPWFSENCDYGNPINHLCTVAPYDARSCTCGINETQCLTDNVDIPDCWAKRLIHTAVRIGDNICDSVVWNIDGPEDGIIFLLRERKQIPPWIPIEIDLPQNLAYVDLFEKPNFKADSDHLNLDDSINFGHALVDSGMPLRIINFPHGSWWEQLYDPTYQRDELLDAGFGLRRTVFKYNYWTKEEDISYVDDAESFILYGLPGTVLALYDYEYALKKFRYYIIPDFGRRYSVADMRRDTLHNKVDFVSWGFGPLADAGNDVTVECRETVILDGGGSYEFALDPAQACSTFGLPPFDYSTLWTYKWLDESDINDQQQERCFGYGETVTTDSVEYGTHLIRLEVSGERIPDPVDINRNRSWVTVRDRMILNVDIGPPIGVISGIVSDPGGGSHGVTVTAWNLDAGTEDQDRCTTLPDTFYKVMCTDENGHYRFDSLYAGNYVVSIIMPIGFASEADSQYTLIADCTCWPPPDTVNFEITPFYIEPAQRTMGFWKHQVNTHLTDRGNPHITQAQLSEFMDLIRIHFNENCANPVTIFQAPQPATLTDSLEALQALLTVNKDGTMNDRAKQQLIALILNVVSLKLHQTHPISEDSATVSQAITYCHQLIADGDKSNDEIAKDIAEKINMGMILPAGLIPLTTPEIMYKGTGEQIAEAESKPGDFYLSQNYPNPFNLNTTIHFFLPVSGRVSLKIYNLLGQKVKTILDQEKMAGEHKVIWDGCDNSGKDVSSGIYFYEFRYGDSVHTKKMLLLK